MNTRLVDWVSVSCDVLTDFYWFTWQVPRATLASGMNLKRLSIRSAGLDEEVPRLEPVQLPARAEQKPVWGQENW